MLGLFLGTHPFCHMQCFLYHLYVEHCAFPTAEPLAFLEQICLSSAVVVVVVVVVFVVAVVVVVVVVVVVGMVEQRLKRL